VKIILMRHGEAGAHAVDAQRGLTDRGRTQTRAVAWELSIAGWEPGLLWSSPYRRAVQTASELAELYPGPAELQDFLVPGGDPEACLEALQQLPEQTAIMLVTHMPLAASLLALRVDGQRQGPGLSTSQAVCLETPVAAPGCAEFRRQFFPE